MPKYNPTPEDMYETNPCFICGSYCLDENSETCGSYFCLMQYEWFIEDLNTAAMDDYWYEDELGMS